MNVGGTSWFKLSQGGDMYETTVLEPVNPSENLLKYFRLLIISV